MIYKNLATLFLFACSFSNERINSQMLKEGDQMPDLTFQHVSNYSSQNLRLSDFKGKLVILDFWGHNCISCVEAFPEIDMLQKEFSKDIQIILVNPESREKTDLFFKKRVKVFKPNLPMISGDTLLSNMFPHQGVPFHVWIDRNGKILYQTDGVYANPGTITKVLNGEHNNIEKRVNTSYVQTFINEQYKPQLIYYSFLTRYDRRHRLEYSEGSDSNVLLSLQCSSPVGMFQAAFSALSDQKEDFVKPGRTLLLFKDTARYRSPENNEMFNRWLENTHYDYQLYWTMGTKEEGYRILLEDLARQFKLKGSIQKRKVKCLALVKTGNLESLRTKGGEVKRRFVRFGLRSEAQDSIRYLLNVPFKMFADRLGMLIEHYYAPFVNEVKMMENVDFRINGDILDTFEIGEIRKVLRSYNLDLVEKTEKLNVLVIEDIN
ncbi:MAG: TlpA family protein disulfide reductase [Sphingobacteriales bacterium]|nr:TlpA family protein disulfide reductase [Sphingobacteriales bacterium]OJV98796.1 MAG: hypothetical protein BGO52_08480 [Sphingobacteriales bacterium 44-61]